MWYWSWQFSSLPPFSLRLPFSAGFKLCPSSNSNLLPPLHCTLPLPHLEGMGLRKKTALPLQLWKTMRNCRYLSFGLCEELGIEARIFEKYLIVTWNHEKVL